MSRQMRNEDAISSKEGLLYLTIGGKVIELAEIIKFEAKLTYIKAPVKAVGKRMEGSKIVGSKGTGSMTLHYHIRENRDMAIEYIRSGKAPIWDATVINDDPTSAAGKQTTSVKNIVPDEALLAKLDGDSDETLKEDIPFTFDDSDYLDRFNKLN